MLVYTFLPSDLWKGSSIVFLAGFNLFKSPKNAVLLMFLSHVIKSKGPEIPLSCEQQSNYLAH